MHMFYLSKTRVRTKHTKPEYDDHDDDNIVILDSNIIFYVRILKYILRVLLYHYYNFYEENFLINSS